MHVEDRGYQFADSVYEVVYLHDGRRIDAELHLDRLDRSLRELKIPPPLGRAALCAVLDEVARRNRLRTGLLYIQISRGVSRREHIFPGAATRPGLVVTVRRLPPFPECIEAWTTHAITAPDERWARCDIKTTGLLANVLAREAARAAGASEAILHRDGLVTEGAATSVWIVGADGVLRTRPLDHSILPGCTRAALLALLESHDTAVEMRAVSLDELRAAREVFLSSATSFVKPVVAIDGAPVGDGTPGPVTRLVFDLLAKSIRGNH